MSMNLSSSLFSGLAAAHQGVDAASSAIVADIAKSTSISAAGEPSGGESSISNSQPVVSSVPKAVKWQRYSIQSILDSATLDKDYSKLQLKPCDIDDDDYFGSPADLAVSSLPSNPKLIDVAELAASLALTEDQIADCMRALEDQVIRSGQCDNDGTLNVLKKRIGILRAVHMSLLNFRETQYDEENPVGTQAGEPIRKRSRQESTTLPDNGSMNVESSVLKVTRPGAGLGVRMFLSLRDRIDFTQPLLCKRMLDTVADIVSNSGQLLKNEPNDETRPYGIVASVIEFIEHSIEKMTNDAEESRQLVESGHYRIAFELLAKLGIGRASVAYLMRLIKVLLEYGNVNICPLDLNKALKSLTPVIEAASNDSADVELYSFGRGDTGRLGQGPSLSTVQCPKLLEPLRDLGLRTMSTFSTHTLAASANGEVYVWGNGQHGRLGTGSLQNEDTPTLLRSLQGQFATQVAVGLSHSVVLTKEGDVYSFGNGINGRLGHGDAKERRTPTLINALKGLRVTYIACGSAFSFALTENGSLYSWGKNTVGQCGHSNLSECNEPIEMQAFKGKRVIDVAGGWDHAIACIDDGKVYSWGCGYEGTRPVLGHGSKARLHTPTQIQRLEAEHVVKVAAGYDHSFAITESGEVFSWGSSSAGQLGVGETGEFFYPVKVTALEGFNIVYADGGMDHTLFVTEEGHVLASGNGTEYALGTNSTTSLLTPQLVKTLEDKFITRVACGDKCSVVLATTLADRLHESHHGDGLTQKVGDITLLSNSPLYAIPETENDTITSWISLIVHCLAAMFSASRRFMPPSDALWMQSSHYSARIRKARKFERFAIETEPHTFASISNVISKLLEIHSNGEGKLFSRAKVEVDSSFIPTALISCLLVLKVNLYHYVRLLSENSIQEIQEDESRIVYNVIVRTLKYSSFEENVGERIRRDAAEALVMGLDVFFPSQKSRISLLHHMLAGYDFDEIMSLNLNPFGMPLREAIMNRLSEKSFLHSFTPEDTVGVDDGNVDVLETLKCLINNLEVKFEYGKNASTLNEDSNEKHGPMKSGDMALLEAFQQSLVHAAFAEQNGSTYVEIGSNCTRLVKYSTLLIGKSTEILTSTLKDQSSESKSTLLRQSIAQHALTLLITNLHFFVRNVEIMAPMLEPIIKLVDAVESVRDTDETTLKWLFELKVNASALCGRFCSACLRGNDMPILESLSVNMTEAHPIEPIGIDSFYRGKHVNNNELDNLLIDEDCIAYERINKLILQKMKDEATLSELHCTLALVVATTLWTMAQKMNCSPSDGSLVKLGLKTVEVIEKKRGNLSVQVINEIRNRAKSFSTLNIIPDQLDLSLDEVCKCLAERNSDGQTIAIAHMCALHNQVAAISFASRFLTLIKSMKSKEIFLSTIIPGLFSPKVQCVVPVQVEMSFLKAIKSNVDSAQDSIVTRVLPIMASPLSLRNPIAWKKFGFVELLREILMIKHLPTTPSSSMSSTSSGQSGDAAESDLRRLTLWVMYLSLFKSRKHTAEHIFVGLNQLCCESVVAFVQDNVNKQSLQSPSNSSADNNYPELASPASIASTTLLNAPRTFKGKAPGIRVHRDRQIRAKKIITKSGISTSDSPLALASSSKDHSSNKSSDFTLLCWLRLDFAPIPNKKFIVCFRGTSALQVSSAPASPEGGSETSESPVSNANVQIVKKNSDPCVYPMFSADTSGIELVLSMTNGTNVSIRGVRPLPLNQWIHVGCSLRNRELKLFVDGVVLGSKVAYSPIVALPQEAIYLGGAPHAVIATMPQYESLRGSLQGVRWLTNCIEPQIITAVYEAGPTHVGPKDAVKMRADEVSFQLLTIQKLLNHKLNDAWYETIVQAIQLGSFRMRMVALRIIAQQRPPATMIIDGNHSLYDLIIDIVERGIGSTDHSDVTSISCHASLSQIKLAALGEEAVCTLNELRSNVVWIQKLEQSLRYWIEAIQSGSNVSVHRVKMVCILLGGNVESIQVGRRVLVERFDASPSTVAAGPAAELITGIVIGRDIFNENITIFAPRRRGIQSIGESIYAESPFCCIPCDSIEQAVWNASLIECACDIFNYCLEQVLKLKIPHDNDDEKRHFSLSSFQSKCSADEEKATPSSLHISSWIDYACLLGMASKCMNRMVDSINNANDSLQIVFKDIVRRKGLIPKLVLLGSRTLAMPPMTVHWTLEQVEHKIRSMKCTVKNRQRAKHDYSRKSMKDTHNKITKWLAHAEQQHKVSGNKRSIAASLLSSIDRTLSPIVSPTIPLLLGDTDSLSGLLSPTPHVGLDPKSLLCTSGDVEKQTYSCPLCGKKDMTFSALYNHFDAQHAQGVCRGSCPLCRRSPLAISDVVYSDLRKHFQQRHADLLCAPIDGSKSNETEKSSNVDQDSVAKLMAMGFEVDHCIYALEANHEDIVAATNWLLNNLGTVGALVESKKMAEQEQAATAAQRLQEIASEEHSNPYIKSVKQIEKDAIQARDFLNDESAQGAVQVQLCFGEGNELFPIQLELCNGQIPFVMPSTVRFKKMIEVSRYGNDTYGVDSEQYANMHLAMAVLGARRAFIVASSILSQSPMNLVSDDGNNNDGVTYEDFFALLKLILFRGDMCLTSIEHRGYSLSPYDIVSNILISLLQSDHSDQANSDSDIVHTFILLECEEQIEALCGIETGALYDEVLWGLRDCSTPDIIAALPKRANCERISFLLKHLLASKPDESLLTSLIPSLSKCCFHPNVVVKTLGYEGLSRILSSTYNKSSFIELLPDYQRIQAALSMRLTAEMQQRRIVHSAYVRSMIRYCIALDENDKSRGSVKKTDFLDLTDLIERKDFIFDNQLCGHRLVISEDGLTARRDNTSDGWQLCFVRASFKQSSNGGIYSWGFIVDNTKSGMISFGIANKPVADVCRFEDTWTPTQFDSISCMGDGSIWNKSSLICRTGVSFATRDHVGFTLDINTSRLAVYRNGIRMVTVSVEFPSQSLLVPYVGLYNRDDSISIHSEYWVLHALHPGHGRISCYSEALTSLSILEYAAANQNTIKLEATLLRQGYKWFRKWVQCKLLPYRTHKGPMLFFDCSSEASGQFGLQSGQYVSIANNRALIVGVHRGKIWIHVHGEKGARRMTTKESEASIKIVNGDPGNDFSALVSTTNARPTSTICEADFGRYGQIDRETDLTIMRDALDEFNAPLFSTPIDLEKGIKSGYDLEKMMCKYIVLREVNLHFCALLPLVSSGDTAPSRIDRAMKSLAPSIVYQVKVDFWESLLEKTITSTLSSQSGTEFSGLIPTITLRESVDKNLLDETLDLLSQWDPSSLRRVILESADAVLQHGEPSSTEFTQKLKLRPFNVVFASISAPKIAGHEAMTEFIAKIMKEAFAESSGLFQKTKTSTYSIAPHQNEKGDVMRFYRFGILVGVAALSRIQMELPLQSTIWKTVADGNPTNTNSNTSYESRAAAAFAQGIRQVIPTNRLAYIVVDGNEIEALLCSNRRARK